tara:strand:+ start:2929 stop:3819 length:891 start_codon:yes stop_codon:yes gene_type:complete
MFDLFKSKPVVKKLDLRTKSILPTKKTDYPAIVYDIHNEFRGAADILLAEAKEILARTPVANVSKSNLLKSFGFNNVKEVAEVDIIAKTIKLSTSQIEMINGYRIDYPYQKFITEEQVEAICKKYNLVFGVVGQFTGFVPEKNIKEIANFKLKEKDATTITVPTRTYSSAKIINITLNNYEVRKVGNYQHIYVKGSSANSNYAFQGEGGGFYGSDSYNLFGLRHLGDMRFNLEVGLKICAPVKDMNMDGYSLSKGYKLLKDIPDPVVLQAVPGGYLILTAWGDEASDPMVVNETFN